MLDLTDPTTRTAFEKLLNANQDLLEEQGVTFPVDLEDGRQIQQAVEALQVIAHGRVLGVHLVPTRKGEA